METVTLCTANGAEVTKVQMPFFVEAPTVVLWGARMFTHYAFRQYREVTPFICDPLAVVRI